MILVGLWLVVKDLLPFLSVQEQLQLLNVLYSSSPSFHGLLDVFYPAFPRMSIVHIIEWSLESIVANAALFLHL